jgi:hypothetical protein
MKLALTWYLTFSGFPITLFKKLAIHIGRSSQPPRCRATQPSCPISLSSYLNTRTISSTTLGKYRSEMRSQRARLRSPLSQRPIGAPPRDTQCNHARLRETRNEPPSGFPTRNLSKAHPEKHCLSSHYENHYLSQLVLHHSLTSDPVPQSFLPARLD